MGGGLRRSASDKRICQAPLQHHSPREHLLSTVHTHTTAACEAVAVLRMITCGRRSEVAVDACGGAGLSRLTAGEDSRFDSRGGSAERQRAESGRSSSADRVSSAGLHPTLCPRYMYCPPPTCPPTLQLSLCPTALLTHHHRAALHTRYATGSGWTGRCDDVHSSAAKHEGDSSLRTHSHHRLPQTSPATPQQHRRGRSPLPSTPSSTPSTATLPPSPSPPRHLTRPLQPRLPPHRRAGGGGGCGGGGEEGGGG